MKPEKIIIGLVGEAASGKGTAAAYLLGKYGAKTLAFSTPMKDCLRRLRVELSRENLTVFSEFTRKTYGEDLFARVVAADAKDAPDAMVVVDGIRRPADYGSLKDLPGFHLLYITAPVELRWQRARNRGEKAGESEMSLEEFKKEELLPTELEINSIGERAEFIIDNRGKIEELYASMESIVEYVKAGDFDHPHPHRNRLHPEK